MTGDVRPEGAQTGVFQTPEGRRRRWSDSNKRLDARQIGVAQQPVRERISAADAVLFVTPEHNRSVPAALKNALDVGSRPYGKSAWNGKPGAVVSASPGTIGGFGANHHLRQSLVFLNMPTMSQPEAYIGGADKLIDSEGKLTNDGTRKFLMTFMQSYAAWISANIES